MKDQIKQKADLMAQNFHELKGAFFWDSNISKHFGAMISATRESSVNIEMIKEIKEFIKKNTSMFSSFRGNNEFIFAILLHGEKDYRGLFQKTIKVFNDLKTHGFKSGNYLPLAAYTIAKNCEERLYSEVFNRMERFYEKMKQNHFWLTSHDDYVFAAVLASADLDVESTALHMEECYHKLNAEGLYKGNELQSLSHVLALGEEDAAAKCHRAKMIYDRLNERKCKLRYHGLTSLGVLTLVSNSAEQISQEVAEVYDYLYNTEGYGFWGVDSNLRAILSAGIVCDYYAGRIGAGVAEVALANSISAIIIAQQTAAAAAIIAASSAAASSASS